MPDEVKTLREAYNREIASGSTPGYWEMNHETLILFKLDGQDFCGLPVNIMPSGSLGEWWLYPADENDLVYQQIKGKINGSGT